MIYGTAWKEDRTQALVELALRAGFRAIDTANQRKHYFEAGVGRALAAAIRAGLVQRADVFLQTKFTYVRGQDHRLPYDPSAPLPDQVRQSLASSLEHLGVPAVDSFVLHGPSSWPDWSPADDAVWRTMTELRDAGQARVLGVSNVSLGQLSQLCDTGAVPHFVQNRCFARTGWDQEVRAFCRERGVVYQGFSLLTANPQVVGHPVVAACAARLAATPAQVVFAFCRQLGILPLTGTTSAVHMAEDLASATLVLTEADVRAIAALG